MYSFPFCKSVLMLYFNKTVLAEAGIEAPPQTWDQFLAQCRRVKAKTGHPAYAVSVDPSTIAGMIFSMGGEVAAGRETLFDSPAALKTFGLLETLAKEKLAYHIAPRSYDDEVALAQGDVAFVMRSSSGRTSVTRLMNDLDKWGMTRIPQADTEHPRTVLFGPNICVFNTTPEQQRAGWEFVKFFTCAERPHTRAARDRLPLAQSEPTLAGGQEVRGLVDVAETEILTGLKPAAQAAADLKRKADAVLARP